MSGGLAVAEVLGRFGTEGVTSAYYWTSPAQWSPAFWAFRAFRNFDEHGARFQDWSVRASAIATDATLYASRDADGRHLVAVLLNVAPESPLAVRVNMASCGGIATARAFTYVGGDGGFKPSEATPAGPAVSATVPPYSITVFDVTTPSVTP